MKYSLQNLIRLTMGVSLAVALATVANARNVVERLAERPEFSTLVTAVTEAGLV